MRNSVPPGSFNRLNYLLRPTKQIERKIIVEALHRLATYGYPIPEYKYIGFGSVYFADFLLFHKYLYIQDMLCIEGKPVERRMKFNKPFDFVELYMGPASEALPLVDRARRHLLWLDYDLPLNGDIMSEVSTALNVLAPGSILIVTVTAQLSEVERAASLEENKARREKVAKRYQEWIGHLLGDIRPEMLSRRNLPGLFSRALRSQIIEAVNLRQDGPVSFSQMFNFQYADGVTMLTFGGIVETPQGLERLESTGYLNSPHLWRAEDPMTISVPVLTVREKQWLDQNLDAARADPSIIEFEIEEEALKNYCRFYRYYPVYYETLI